MHSTTLSLTSASAQISKSASPTDAALFLISHLLLLKQQIVAFDIEFVTPETDIHYDIWSVTNTFWELRSRGGLFNPRNLVGLLIPKVVDNMLDAKAEVDARLRQAITDLTGLFRQRITAPIDTSSGKKVPVNEAAARTAKVRQNVEAETPFLRAKLEAYITDARTREMLGAAVMEAVAQTYEDWFDASYTASLNGGAGARSAKGKGREDGVWDPDVFGEWCGNAFRVDALGGGGGGGSGSESESDEDSTGAAVSSRMGAGKTGGLSIR